MGMYTRLTMWAELKPDSAAVPIIKYMLEGGEQPSIPDHPLFGAERWDFMLRCQSYYHTTQGTTFRHDENARAWFLNIDCSFKNYDDELKHFLDWFATVDDTPVYSEPEHAGFFRYEEIERPTLIYRVTEGAPYRLVQADG